MNARDTIFALSTPYAKAGIAVFRISGSALLAGVEGLLSQSRLTPRHATYCKLLRPSGGQIDDVLATYFPAPNSFTGEDVLEIACHGSTAVIDAVASRLTAIPHWRQASPGEFSRRAFRNGRMDLAEAEGLADVLNARTQRQLQFAQERAWGSVSSAVATWRQGLVALQALAEASIDFADDLDSDVDDQIRTKAKDFAMALQSALDHGRAATRLLAGYQVALVGPPNAGKSSLLNALSDSDAAIVTDIPGTTRDQLSVEISLDGLPVRLVDSAGLRETSDAVEAIGVQRAKSLASSADLVIAVLAPGQTLEGVDAYDLLVETHADQNPAVETATASDTNETKLNVSSTTGQGIDRLRDAIAATLSQDLPDPATVAFVQDRQRQAVLTCLAELHAVESAPALDLVGEHLRQAARALSEITGEIDVEDVLDVVFGSFCIGK